jgi:hypothetical protein
MVGGFFGGGSAPAEQQDGGAVASQGQQAEQNSWGGRSCEVDAKQFTKCMDDNQGNMQICNWYLEQLVRSLSNTILIVTNDPSPSESLSIRCQPILKIEIIPLALGGY